jgi:hypothetical protein
MGGAGEAFTAQGYPQPARRKVQPLATDSDRRLAAAGAASGEGCGRRLVRGADPDSIAVTVEEGKRRWRAEPLVGEARAAEAALVQERVPLCAA